MAKQVIGVGTIASDGTGDTPRAAGQKINANFTELYDADTANAAALAGKQATLVSGTNIKTVNGSSILGSGNLAVSLPSLFGAGVIIGDSTSASYSGQNAISTYMLETADVTEGNTITSLAVSGHTILQQQTAWTADTNKATYDYIFVNIGHNDTITLDPAATILGRYQTLINTINAGKKSSAIVIVTTMTPAKQGYIDLLGSTDGATAYQRWLDVNIGIMGGANAITGVNYRIDTHTKLLNDNSGNLIYGYQVDTFHQNNSGRKVQASIWRQKLAEIGYFSKSLVSPPYVAYSDSSVVMASVSVGGTSSLIGLIQSGNGISMTGNNVLAGPAISGHSGQILVSGVLRVNNAANSVENLRVADNGDVTIAAGRLMVTTPVTPASASASGTIGSIVWDTGFIYVCVATNTWKRVAIATW